MGSRSTYASRPDLLDLDEGAALPGYLEVSLVPFVLVKPAYRKPAQLSLGRYILMQGATEKKGVVLGHVKVIQNQPHENLFRPKPDIDTVLLQNIEG